MPHKFSLVLWKDQALHKIGLEHRALATTIVSHLLELLVTCYKYVNYMVKLSGTSFKLDWQFAELIRP